MIKNTSERVKKAILHVKMGGIYKTQADIAEAIGVRSTYLSDVINGQVNLSESFSDKFVKIFSEINKEWLLTGKGEMLKSSLQEQVSDTAIKRNLIPLYEAETIGGVNERRADLSGISAPIQYIDAGDWFPNASAAMRHYGDSMVQYPSGCILALKEVYERQLIIWGRDYVIETAEYRITKRVQRGKDDKYIKACSSNIEKYPDGSLIHEPIDIAWKDIRHILLVLGYVVKQSSGNMVFNTNNQKN